MSDETETQFPKFTVNGHEFHSNRIYSPGHVLEENEAAYLTNAYRDAQAAAVRVLYNQMLRDLNSNRSEDDPIIEELTGSNKANFTKRARKLLEEFVLSVRVSKASVDPVEERAKKIAKNQLMHLLRERGSSFKAAKAKNEDRLNEMWEKLAASESIRNEAKEALAREAEIASQTIDNLDLSGF